MIIQTQIQKETSGFPTSLECTYACLLISHGQWPPFGRRHFQVHFLNENVRIFIQFSLEFVPKCPIYNTSALVQVMAWCLFGTKPLPEPMLIQFTDAYIYAALGGNEVTPEVPVSYRYGTPNRSPMHMQIYVLASLKPMLCWIFYLTIGVFLICCRHSQYVTQDGLIIKMIGILIIK